MKTLKTFMVIAVCAVAAMSVEPAFAQEYTKKEKRELRRDMDRQQEDFYDKAPKLARKEARRLEKEGWKAMGIPIEKQLETYYDRVALFDLEGYPKYIYVEVQATGTNFSAAQMQAENVAKLRLASNICSSIAALTDLSLANNETSPELTASLSKALENAKIIVSQKLGRVFIPMTIYQQTRNTYTVRVAALYDQKQAIQIAHDVILQELANESEENKRQLEALLGMDSIQEQYNKMEFDEEL